MDVTTDVNLNDINQFTEDHQQAEEQDHELESDRRVSYYRIECVNV
jgi:hypothetical protein